MTDDLGETVTPEEAARLLRDATPGPWHARPDTPWGTKVVLAPGTGEFYLGVDARHPVPTEGWSAEARARAADLGRRKCHDARLIAAAPRLAATIAQGQVKSWEEWQALRILREYANTPRWKVRRRRLWLREATKYALSHSGGHISDTASEGER